MLLQKYSNAKLYSKGTAQQYKGGFGVSAVMPTSGTQTYININRDSLPKVPQPAPVLDS